MTKLVECVPNFSEGRNSSHIQSIAQEIRSSKNVRLLHVDCGEDTNRTVMTFVGEIDYVLDAAFKAITKAVELIDMREHQGTHPRLGAIDVCPFIPLTGVTMNECIRLAQQLGQMVGENLKIPVYLYGYAALYPYRRDISDIRRGQYEGLSEKIRIPNWKPDFGPAEFNPKTGATIIGARHILIAYNINLAKKCIDHARYIAANIRESGLAVKDSQGNTLVDHMNNVKKRTAGKFKECKAIGWYLSRNSKVQVSTNLTNYHITPPHLVYDECCRLAKKVGNDVSGSEIVGLVPLDVLVTAGRFYSRNAKGYTENELVQLAIEQLGLDDLYDFDPKVKILDYQLEH